MKAPGGGLLYYTQQFPSSCLASFYIHPDKRDLENLNPCLRFCVFQVSPNKKVDYIVTLKLFFNGLFTIWESNLRWCKLVA